MKLPRSGLLKVNGAAIPDPASLTFGLQDLDDSEGSGRNANGVMFRDRVAIKRKLTLSWNPMETSDLSFILNAIKDPFFDVTFAEDPYANGSHTFTAYAGDRSMPLLLKNARTGRWLWQSLSVNFIEQ